MDFINYFFTDYFSEPQNVIFWALVAIAILLEELIKHYKNRKMMELWMKEHKIADKKYKVIRKKRKIEEFPIDKKSGYIDAAWKEIEK